MNTIHTATRTAAANGKYRYTTGPLEWTTKVLYTHQAWHALTDQHGTIVEPREYVVTDHKTEAAAMKASYKYGIRVAVMEIQAA
jgi:hypothetical protein